MNRLIFFCFWNFFFLVCFQTTFAQVPQQRLPEKTRILFLLDGSGSMLARWENTYRIAVAKSLLSDIVDSLRVDEDLELALRVYGHQYDRRLRRCDDTRLEVPFSNDNHDRILNALKNVGPKGTTPIAYALEQAARDFPGGDDTRNIIIIITDGIESCDGDPCAVSLSLQKKGIFLKPFVIGIGMDRDFEAQFGCMGSFYDAANVRAFKNALNQALFQSLETTTVSIELLDQAGKGTETNVNVSLINHFTQISAFEFVHYRDEVGMPDSVEIDPVLTYDVVVNTIPPVRREKINLRAGTHNVIEIPSPQGYLQISQPGTTEYENGVLALIREPGMPDILTTMNLPATKKLLVGQYDVVLTTVPRKTFQRVEVRQGHTTKMEIEQPGVVNFVATARGFGSIYEISGDGTQRWIYNLNPQILRTTLAIQPGSYKIVFRAESAKGSKYTSIQEFEVKPGSSLNMRL